MFYLLITCNNVLKLYKQFIWTPYDAPKIRRIINDFWVSNIIYAMVPLICYVTVEWHPVDRVMRQFGFKQGVPNPPRDLGKFHNMDFRGQSEFDWGDYHRTFISEWNNWNNTMIYGQPYTGLEHENSEYMEWYIAHTRRYMSREGAISALSTFAVCLYWSFYKC